MSRRFTLAVERVADDRRFADRFRHDPARSVRRYGMSTDQVEALKAGDLASLAQHGLDVEQFDRGDRHGWRPHWRKLVLGATLLGAVVGLAGSPAAAEDPSKLDSPLLEKRFNGFLRASRGRAGCAGIRKGLIGRSSIRKGLSNRNLIRKGFVLDGVRFAPGHRFVRGAVSGLRSQDCGFGEFEVDGPFLIADGS